MLPSLQAREYFNLRIFKSTIKPTWEDAANRDGGKWSVIADAKEWPQQWQKVLLAVIGNQLDFSDLVRFSRTFLVVRATLCTASFYSSMVVIFGSFFDVVGASVLVF